MVVVVVVVVVVFAVMVVMVVVMMVVIEVVLAIVVATTMITVVVMVVRGETGTKLPLRVLPLHMQVEGEADPTMVLAERVVRVEAALAQL